MKRNKNITNTTYQLVAMGQLLLKAATELKNGRPVKNQAGPRKGLLTEEQKQQIVSRRIRIAIKKS